MTMHLALSGIYLSVAVSLYALATEPPAKRLSWTIQLALGVTTVVLIHRDMRRARAKAGNDPRT